MSDHPKILVAYASRHGQTAAIAGRLASDLEARGAETTVIDVADVPPGLSVPEHDLVVVGAPVYFDRHLKGAAGFAIDHRETLARRPGAFFSVSGSAADGTPEGDARVEAGVDRFLAETGWRPERVARFAGAVPYTRYNVLLRWVMKRIQKKAGRSTDTSRDHVYTDWDAVEDFARELLRIARRRAGAPAD